LNIIKGKPGYIAEDCFNSSRIENNPNSSFYNPFFSSLIIKVKYGTHPRLSVEILSTYAANTGAFEVSTSLLESPIILLKNEGKNKINEYKEWQRIDLIDNKRGRGEWEMLKYTITSQPDL
jgi:hypothetical protein